MHIHTHTHTFNITCMHGQMQKGYRKLTPGKDAPLKGLIIFCRWMQKKHTVWKTECRTLPLKTDIPFISYQSLYKGRMMLPFIREL